jgi:hypothetical protein
VAGVDGRAQAGHHAAAEQAGHRGRGLTVHNGALPGRDQRLLRERADAQGGRRRGAVGRVICCVALCVLKQYQGRPRRQDRQAPQTARQLSTTKSPGFTSVTPSPTCSTTPAASCPSR